MDHIFHTPLNCHKENCFICDGGLSVCIVCHQAEIELEASCPGPTQRQSMLIVTASGRVYTWTYMPHSQVVVFYNGGKDIGMLDTKTNQAGVVVHQPVHPDLEEVVRIFREQYQASLL
jgi:hypothetical protein